MRRAPGGKQKAQTRPYGRLRSFFSLGKGESSRRGSATVNWLWRREPYSDLDMDIYNLYETWHWSYGRSEEPLEELVERTISSMEMTLAE